MTKILKIEFSKSSSSKNIRQALNLSKKLNAVIDGDLVRIELDIQEIFNRWELVNAILNIIDKWKSFNIYFKDRLCVVNKDYRTLFYALQELKQCYHANQDDPEDYEKCNEKWGCNKVNYIALGLRDQGVRHWFEYGHLVNPDTWAIDKNKILKEVQMEIERKHLKACPAFPLSRIQAVIDQLPDIIKIDENWHVIYKTEMVNGVLTRVNSELRFNVRSDEDWRKMDNLLTQINEESFNPYPVGSDQFLDWINDAKKRFKK